MPSGMIFGLQETASGSEMDGIDGIKRTTDSVHDQRVLVRRFPLRSGVDFLIAILQDNRELRCCHAPQ